MGCGQIMMKKLSNDTSAYSLVKAAPSGSLARPGQQVTSSLISWKMLKARDDSFKDKVTISGSVAPSIRC